MVWEPISTRSRRVQHYHDLSIAVSTMLWTCDCRHSKRTACCGGSGGRSAPPLHAGHVEYSDRRDSPRVVRFLSPALSTSLGSAHSRTRGVAILVLL
jgi:hypothetical protein